MWCVLFAVCGVLFVVGYCVECGVLCFCCMMDVACCVLVAVGVGRRLLVVRCLLCVECCLLCVVLVFVDCCLLFWCVWLGVAGYWLLSVVGCLVFDVRTLL